VSEYFFRFLAGALPLRTHDAREKVRFVYLNAGRVE